MKISINLIAALVSVVVWPMAASAQKMILTNEQIVISSVREAAEKAMRSHKLNKIQLSIATSGIERPVSNGIAEALKSLGAEVVADAIDSESTNDLNYDVLGFDFDYEKGASRGFLRRPMIKREFAARIRITMSRSIEGSILGFDEIAVSYVDNIDPRFIDLVKSRDILELAPDLPGSGWTKIAEPVIVTAAIGGLVYLFFANR